MPIKRSRQEKGSREYNKQDIEQAGIVEKIIDQDCLASLKEIACYLSVSISSVRSLIQNSGLPAAKSGKQYIISKALINRWMIQNHLHRIEQLGKRRRVSATVKREDITLSDKEIEKILEISSKRASI